MKYGKSTDMFFRSPSALLPSCFRAPVTSVWEGIHLQRVRFDLYTVSRNLRQEVAATPDIHGREEVLMQVVDELYDSILHGAGAVDEVER